MNICKYGLLKYCEFFVFKVGFQRKLNWVRNSSILLQGCWSGKTLLQQNTEKLEITLAGILMACNNKNFNWPAICSF